jgi:hypothetical protein
MSRASRLFGCSMVMATALGRGIAVSAFFSASLLLLAGSVVAVPHDPSGGLCDSLDPSSGLFSTCIQAHNATNRLEHLESVSASYNAITNAQAQLDSATAQYALLGGGTVPGFDVRYPSWTDEERAGIAAERKQFFWLGGLKLLRVHDNDPT